MTDLPARIDSQIALMLDMWGKVEPRMLESLSAEEAADALVVFSQAHAADKPSHFDGQALRKGPAPQPVAPEPEVTYVPEPAAEVVAEPEPDDWSSPAEPIAEVDPLAAMPAVAFDFEPEPAPVQSSFSVPEPVLSEPVSLEAAAVEPTGVPLDEFEPATVAPAQPETPQFEPVVIPEPVPQVAPAPAVHASDPEALSSASDEFEFDPTLAATFGMDLIDTPSADPEPLDTPFSVDFGVPPDLPVAPVGEPVFDLSGGTSTPEFGAVQLEESGLTFAAPLVELPADLTGYDGAPVELVTAAPAGEVFVPEPIMESALEQTLEPELVPAAEPAVIPTADVVVEPAAPEGVMPIAQPQAEPLLPSPESSFFAPEPAAEAPDQAVSPVDQVLAMDLSGSALDIKPTEPPVRKALWVLPLALGIPGGIVAWFISRHEAPRQARVLLIAGVVITIVSAIVGWGLTGIMGQSNLRNQSMQQQLEGTTPTSTP